METLLEPRSKSVGKPGKRNKVTLELIQVIKRKLESFTKSVLQKPENVNCKIRNEIALGVLEHLYRYVAASLLH